MRPGALAGRLQYDDSGKEATNDSTAQTECSCAPLYRGAPLTGKDVQTELYN
jgi:hypothetical protein